MHAYNLLLVPEITLLNTYNTVHRIFRGYFRRTLKLLIQFRRSFPRDEFDSTIRNTPCTRAQSIFSVEFVEIAEKLNALSSTISDKMNSSNRICSLSRHFTQSASFRREKYACNDGETYARAIEPLWWTHNMHKRNS